MEEAKLSLLRRIGAPEGRMLIVQGNLACTYDELGRLEEALRLRKDVYSRRLQLNGKEPCEDNLRAALNYATSLMNLKRYGQAKVVLRKAAPVAGRVLGESHDLALKIRWFYAAALYQDDDASPDDLREAVTTLEDAERTARRVFGAAHPLVAGFEGDLRHARAALRRETTPPAGGA